MPHFITRNAAVPLLVLALFVVPATAMAPMSRPEVNREIMPGKAEPFVGSWSLVLPARDVSDGDTELATCALPVRIEEADETHIFYLGPNEVEADAAIELIAAGDGADWKPIAGGPAFFAVWVTPDSFYLYDAVAEGERDWSAPYVYNRCE